MKQEASDLGNLTEEGVKRLKKKQRMYFPAAFPSLDVVFLASNFCLFDASGLQFRNYSQDLVCQSLGMCGIFKIECCV